MTKQKIKKLYRKIDRKVQKFNTLEAGLVGASVLLIADAMKNHDYFSMATACAYAGICVGSYYVRNKYFQKN